jgi:hypothetical protein
VGPTRAEARNCLRARRAWGRGGELGHRASRPKGEGRGTDGRGVAGPRREGEGERGKLATGGWLGRARKSAQERRGGFFLFSIFYLAIIFY